MLSFLQDEEYRQLLLTTLAILGLGTVAYRYLEGWSWLDAFYFSFITLTTVGYGDLFPITDAGKIFTIFYILIGIGVILSFIDTLHHHYKDINSKDKG